MIPAIVTSLILAKERSMMEVVPPRLRKIWKAWELRGLVLFSLLLQILLILLGNRRRYIPSLWIRVIVWCAYMLADTVATLGLGQISGDLGNVYDEGGVVDFSNELAAFWAPFLLLHLGGPDTITAYSIEDTGLWLRRLFELLNQTTVTVYIFLMAWSSSRLSILTIPIFIAGLIKYGERTWNLWKASADELRVRDPGPNYAKFMEEYAMRQAEGFIIEDIPQVTDEVNAPEEFFSDDKMITEANIRVTEAYGLLESSKGLFADLLLSKYDVQRSRSLFLKMSHEDAFDVIATEIGFVYDLLYTKAKVMYTPWGLACRFITLSLTSSVLVIFSCGGGDKNKNIMYKRMDVLITFFLLGVAIFLEVYAALVLLFSDRAKVFFIKHRKTTILKPINCLRPLFQLPRWSGLIGQYTLLDACVKDNPAFKLLGKYRYLAYSKVTEDFTSLIFSYLKTNLDQTLDLTHGVSLSQRLVNIHEKYRERTGLSLDWSTDAEFHNSIFVWHIATELCYYTDDQTEDNCPSKSSRTASQSMSRYLAYLLVFHPFMLPLGTSYITMRATEDYAKRIVEDTGAEAERFFERRQLVRSGATEMIRRSACDMLLQVKTDIKPVAVKGDRSKSVLFDGCRIASALNRLSDRNSKWDFIRDIWLEMLAYASAHSKGSNHAQQLRRGGELLSLVWLLSTHFGMTEQVEISKRGQARARLVVSN